MSTSYKSYSCPDMVMITMRKSQNLCWSEIIGPNNGNLTINCSESVFNGVQSTNIDILCCNNPQSLLKKKNEKAFGTSVGSRAITLKQAAVIAGIFEFVGAVGLGATVTKTVRKGIVNFDLFEGEEDILLLGMFCALLSAALWLLLATKYELPVSTTQSIIGSIAGFALVAKGPEAINWVGHRDEYGNLIKYNGIVFIAIFWIASPFFAAIGSVLFFFPIRKFLLRR
eukprot:347259_1